MTSVSRYSVPALVAALSLGPACATTQIAATTSTSLELATLTVGDSSYQLAACSSGDLEYFLGVDFADQAGRAFARVVIDPLEGPRLRIVVLEGGDARAVILGREQCRQLEADVRHTGWEVNTVRDFSGFVDAECAADDGQEIQLHVRFEHCH